MIPSLTHYFTIRSPVAERQRIALPRPREPILLQLKRFTGENEESPEGPSKNLVPELLPAPNAEAESVPEPDVIGSEIEEVVDLARKINLEAESNDIQELRIPTIS
ncbi:hypothetical protein TNCV_946841 [Trichonephila clavipes]|nr:hypothetical protein TNCV_946841 [Trichonephila clavipes]